MSASSGKTALYGIFHDVYESKETGLCVSHIFSAVIQRPAKRIDALVQDYSGKGSYIHTDGTQSKFNLAAIVPVPAENARSLISVVNRLNEMSKSGIWPFYFSKDMAIKPRHESFGRPAISPDGEINPAPRLQDVSSYTGSSQLTLARINCVRMTMLAAGLAGINVSKIADIEAHLTRGAEVRDRISEAAGKYKVGRQQNAEARGTIPLFGQKNADHSQVTGSASGLSIIESRDPMTFNQLIGALSQKVEGRTMFDWLTKGKAHNFVTEPQDLPAYLEKAMTLAMEEGGQYKVSPASAPAQRAFA